MYPLINFALIILCSDYPNPPGNVRVVDRPSLRSLVLAWEIPAGATLPVTNFYNTPVTGYTVQVWDRAGVGVAYRDWLTLSSPRATSATLTDLHPGVQYGVHVLAQNRAGSTPSAPVNFTTAPSGEESTALTSPYTLANHIPECQGDWMCVPGSLKVLFVPESCKCLNLLLD